MSWRAKAPARVRGAPALARRTRYAGGGCHGEGSGTDVAPVGAVVGDLELVVDGAGGFPVEADAGDADGGAEVRLEVGAGGVGAGGPARGGVAVEGAVGGVEGDAAGGGGVEAGGEGGAVEGEVAGVEQEAVFQAFDAERKMFGRRPLGPRRWMRSFQPEPGGIFLWRSWGRAGV